MKKAISGRQTGKTTKLIQLSADTGALIITMNTNSARSIMERAETMGLVIQHPVVIDTLMGETYQNGLSGKIENVIIDDTEYIIQQILRKFGVSSVQAISICTDDMSDELI